MSSYVLDASAVIALLNEEPGSELVAQAIKEGAAISSVNLAEVVAKLSDSGVAAPAIRAMLSLSDLEAVDFDVELAYQSGGLRPLTRQFGLSLGDRACLSLASRLGLPALTTDRTWRNLHLGVQIQVIR